MRRGEDKYSTLQKVRPSASVKNYAGTLPHVTRVLPFFHCTPNPLPLKKKSEKQTKALFGKASERTFAHSILNEGE